MSLFSEIEKTIERSFRKWTDRVFGAANSDQLLLVHRGILEQIEGKIQTVQRGRQVFPYNYLRVRVVSADPDRRALYEAAFAADRRLERDIREVLTGAGCELARGWAVDVDTAETGERSFEIEYAVRAPAPVGTAARPAAATPATLTVLRGSARAPVYTIAKARVNLGRLEELTDADQRITRRNDVVFEEGSDPANATVSRRHAHIRYDAAAGEYRISDDGSEYGTRIFREGRPIEVPPGSRRGERLHPGDEIYLGRACLRFDLQP